ncbi:hypothetical protein BgiBS90_007173 [Biomphalaria glabrata]|nr:hypothetical protein BgiBS90_007173 [Biomphalaria glabrata]
MPSVFLLTIGGLKEDRPNKSTMRVVYILLAALILCTCQVSASQKLLNRIKRSMMASSTGDGTLQSLRQKRWDYQTDGCHCGSFRIECPGDLFCQWKNKSHDWVCDVNCCGRKCVRKNDRK